MKFVPFFLLAGAMAAVIGGCAAKGNTGDDRKEVELPVFRVAARDTLLYRSYVASVNACKNVELRTKATGYLEEILVDEGQHVKKGQLLFRLGDAEFKVQLSEAHAAVSMAKAEQKGAEVELERVKTLVDKKILSPSELELATARLTAADAKVDDALAKEESARIRMSYTVIRAPFNGLLDRIPHKPGSLITEGSLLTTESDIHCMHAYFNLSENEYLHYIKKGRHDNRLGQAVTLLLADGSVYPYKGTIETMDGEFEKGTGSIAFRASFPNPAGLLKHGASGRIMLSSSVPGGLMIPQRSVFEIQDRNYVYVLNKDNTVSMRSFVPDTRIADFILVKSGIHDGDQIIYEGVQNIRDGVRIRPRRVPADSIMAIQ